MQYVALIPSYEPDDRLYKIIKELYDNNFEVVLVNDGSGSEYDEQFIKCESLVKYLTYDKNHGKGYALKTGFKFIQDNYKDVVVITMDSDGQHTVKDAKNLCNIVKDLDNTILLGRRQRSGKTPLRSMLGNSITRFVYRFSTGIDVYDTQTGLRAFKDDLIPFMLSVEGDRFEYEMNMLLDSPKNNIKLVEENIDVIYEDNNSGSHFNAIRDSFLIYKQIFKFLSSSLASFIVDYILYTILNVATGNLVLSNVCARIISSTFNYSLNKKMVFKDKESIKSSIFKYYLLAAFILAANTGLLFILVKVLHFNPYIAKVIVEAVLFCISYFVQKRFVFTDRKFHFNAKLYSIVFGLLLVGFTIYVALDTFVLATAYVKVESPAVTNAENLSDSEEVATTNSGESAEKETSPVIGEYSYKDAHIEINITTDVFMNTEVYVADIKIDNPDLLKTAFAKNTYGKNITDTTTKIAGENNAIIAINGDFYGTRNKRYVVRDYVVYRDVSAEGKNDLAIYEDGSFEIITEGEGVLESLDNPKIIMAFGPALINNGEVVAEQYSTIPRDYNANPRTAIAYYEEGHYMFVCSDGRTDKSVGLTTYELAQYISTYDVKVAYNLDGGGSSALVFNGKLINKPVNEGSIGTERKVSDIVYIGY